MVFEWDNRKGQKISDVITMYIPKGCNHYRLIEVLGHEIIRRSQDNERVYILSHLLDQVIKYNYDDTAFVFQAHRYIPIRSCFYSVYSDYYCVTDKDINELRICWHTDYVNVVDDNIDITMYTPYEV